MIFLGLSVGYKPRDLEIDQAWAQFLQWIEANDGPQAAAKAPKIVMKAGYGWVEWIEAKPLDDRETAGRFFERAGATLCLLHLLGGTAAS